MEVGDTLEYQWGHNSSDTTTATVITVWSDGYTIEYQVYGQWKTAQI